VIPFLRDEHYSVKIKRVKTVETNMNKILWIFFFCMLLMTGRTLALEISSVAPVRGTPGTLVAISGGPFSSKTQPFLGEQYVAPRITLRNYIEFAVPYLPPGNYSLTVQDNTMIAAQAYQFEVMAPTPQVITINPNILDACSIAPQNHLQIIGRNFLPGAVFLVNGNAVLSSVISSTLLEVQLPALQKPGVYGGSVRNPDGATSLPHSLWINSTPEINSVERGDDFVNHYEIIIHGKNFIANSTLVVKEPEDSTVGKAYQHFSFVSRNTTESISKLGNRVTYVDCQTLIYHRYPTSFQVKDLGLQVLNPDGRSSDQYYVALP
jgi:hypothetical protein